MTEVNLSDIRIRDPFFLKCEDYYFLYGTTDYNTWEGKGTGFDYYKSRDLVNFMGPYTAFRPEEDFWGKENFWAPEVWFWNQKYYMIASFKAEGRCRGIQILSADCAEGPFHPVKNKPVTPEDWECLDGTLCFIENKPYLVFCHEWLQIGDGEICAAEMTADLVSLKEEPKVILRASDAEWTVLHEEFGHKGYVTDGPFLITDQSGRMDMIWSSYGKHGYALGISHAQNGLLGAWEHEKEPISKTEGGHGMIFKGPEEEYLLTLHSPNELWKERVVLYPMKDIFRRGINVEESL